MADRTVSVRLQAEVGSYIAGMSKASAATMRLGESATSAGNTSKGAFDLAGKGPLLFGAAVVAGLGMAIGKSMEFERSMSAVAAATGEGAAALGDLREVAMKAGADTQYSATEAANAITEMAKAGVSTADIMGGGLTGALNLAAAGQLDVADAAGIASVAMTQFNLSGKDLPHVADLLAAGAGKAMGSVDDLGQALNQAGLVASAAGLSIEETTGTLSAFASAGLIGSDAGTSLKTMLQRLQNPSEEAAGTMRELGISMYDANGNFVGMESLAGQLHDSMSDLTPATRDAAMATIFGSDAVRAANVLYAEGAEGINHWTSAVDDSGFAAEQAAALNDNLSGDLERLGGSFDTLLITIGSGLQGPLRGLTQFFGTVLDGVTSAANAFGDLPGPVQGAIGAFAAWAVAGDKVIDAIGWIGDKLEPVKEALSSGWDAAKTAMSDAAEAGGGLGDQIAAVGGSAMDAAGGGLKAMAKAIGPELGMAAAAYGVGLLINAFTKSDRLMAAAVEQATDWSKALNEGGQAAANAAAEMVRAEEAHDEAVRTFNNAAINTGSLALANIEEPSRRATEAMRQATDAARAQWSALSPLQQATQKQAEWENNLSYAIAQHGRGSEEARTAQERYAYWTDLAATRSGTLYVAVQETTDGLGAATGVTDGLTGAMALLGDTTGQTEDQIKTQQDALQDWRDNAQGILASFTDPLAIYSQQMQDAATAVANSTEDSSDSWSDYVDTVHFNMDAYATSLEEQNAKQEEWRRNIVLVTQRGGEEVGNILFGMGVEGAGLVTAMVNANDAEFGRMRDGMITDARFAGEGAVRELQAQMVAMAIVGAEGADATVQGLAARLHLGADVVRGIAAQYGINLAEGVNPILVAVGRPRVTIQTNGINRNTTGASPFAEGGYTGDGGKWEPAGVVHRGEFVITKERTAKLGVSTLENLERILPGYAGGGFVTGADVPRPPGTGVAGEPLSSAAAGTMDMGYTSVKSWVDYLYAVHQATTARAASGAASPNGAGGLGPKAAAAREFTMQRWGITNIGGFAARNIAGTGTPSDHSTGHAIDIMLTPDYNSPGKRKLGSDIAEYFRTNPGQFGTKYVIYYDRIANGGAGWTPYKHPGGGSSDTLQHRDHVHLSVFDQGGVIEGGQLGANLSGKPERILSPRQTEAFEQWMSGREVSGAAMSGASGGSVRSVQYGDIHVTANPDRESIARVVKQVLHEREVLTSPWAS